MDGKSLWSLLDTMKHHIPVPFTLPELMALYFGSTMLKVFKGTFFYDSLETLSQKIKTTLRPESLKYLKSVEQTMHMGIRPHKDYAKFRGILKQVNEAAAARKTIEIVYYTMSRKKETRRSVDPYRI
jgi:predicted DNA-binding transcriptional regulator YafY